MEVNINKCQNKKEIFEIAKQNEKGITLVALVVTIIVLLILAGIGIAAWTGEGGIVGKASKAREEALISEYKEKIEMMKVDLRIQNKNFTPVTTNQIKDELDKKENEKWVRSTEIIKDEGIEKVKLTTKEGYIFYITEEKTEYKGKGDAVDTSELKKDGVLEIRVTQSTEKGKLVQITDKSGKNYYSIKYQIGSKEGKWENIESGKEVEVENGKTIYAKLVYGPDSGIVHELSIEHTNPVIVASEIDTSKIRRKTQIEIAELFKKTWGSEGTGETEYSITGNLKFNNEPFNKNISNLSELELGTYIITCKITSPIRKEIYATAQKEVKVTTLADERVTDEAGTELGGYAIYSSYDLVEFRELVNGGQANINAKQKENIDLNLGKWTTNAQGITTFTNEAVKWTSIGTSNYNTTTWQLTAKRPFNGIYDGGNYEINGLYINNNLGYGAGLFGYSGGIIKNVTLKNSTVIDSNNVGGILGWGSNAKILNCKNYANIKGSFCTGGICGVLNNANETFKIENCENYGKIEEAKKLEQTSGGIAGIVGFVNGEISKCRNYGEVIANCSNVKCDLYAAGGIVGRSENLKVINCANEANVTTVGNVSGGIVGVANCQAQAEISGCYNTGNITSNMNLEGYSGGITSYSQNTNIINCYNKGNITGDRAAGIAEWVRRNNGKYTNYKQLLSARKYYNFKLRISSNN